MRRKIEDKALLKTLKIKKCAVCGKVFCRINYNDYAYKSDSKFFCGYGCMQEARQRGIAKLQNKE